MKTYLHPTNEILLGVSETAVYAAFRAAQTGELVSVTLNATADEIDAITDAWMDDDHDQSEMQNSYDQMEWIDARINEKDAAPLFVAEAKKYVQ